MVYLNSKNRASGGALMHHNGPLTLRDSTFVNNRSEDAGGAILIAQTTLQPGWNRATLSNLTVVGNRADALRAYPKTSDIGYNLLRYHFTAEEVVNG